MKQINEINPDRSIRGYYHYERMLIFCVAAKPDIFKTELRSDVTPVSRLLTSSDKLYTFLSILNLTMLSVRCLLNNDLEVFAVSGTDGTIAVP